MVDLGLVVWILLKVNFIVLNYKKRKKLLESLKNLKYNKMKCVINILYSYIKIIVEMRKKIVILYDRRMVLKVWCSIILCLGNGFSGFISLILFLLWEYVRIEK